MITATRSVISLKSPQRQQKQVHGHAPGDCQLCPGNDDRRHGRCGDVGYRNRDSEALVDDFISRSTYKFCLIISMGVYSKVVVFYIEFIISSRLLPGITRRIQAHPRPISNPHFLLLSGSRRIQAHPDDENTQYIGQLIQGLRGNSGRYEEMIYSVFL